MTNTQQITVNQPMNSRGHPVMHGWTEQNQVVIRARIRERELEAASERLAATAHATLPTGVRRTIGRMLISAGRPPARPARPMAA
jgi:hypothetical protein